MATHTTTVMLRNSFVAQVCTNMLIDLFADV